MAMIITAAFTSALTSHRSFLLGDAYHVGLLIVPLLCRTLACRHSGCPGRGRRPRPEHLGRAPISG